MKRKVYISSFLLLFTIAIFLNGSTFRKNPKRGQNNIKVSGWPAYHQMFGDGLFRIYVFWGWEHPKETILNVIPTLDALNGKYFYFQGRPVRIEVGMCSPITSGAKEIFKNALEDPTIDLVIYSGHGRYGRGMAFEGQEDIFRSGDGDVVEDRSHKPYKYVKADDYHLKNTSFPPVHKIVLLNCCDSEGHFRKAWNKRFQECKAPIELVTVEYPVFNLYDDVRVVNFITDLLNLADWPTIKENYEAEVHKRKNILLVNPVNLYSYSHNHY